MKELAISLIKKEKMSGRTTLLIIRLRPSMMAT